MNEQTDHKQFESEVPPLVETAPAEQPPDEVERLTVVGIGASAGGLTALTGFFDAMPADTGMAFVVVTHMDPERESLLPEILQKHTEMPVRQVQALTAIESDHVYVIPPGRRILVTGTHLDAEAFDEPRGLRTPVDYFFRSVANAHRQAVAVILSGGGTDGAVGVKAIKEDGGLLVVQDPVEAEHDGMPRAAIATGLADMVLPVAELAVKLAEYHRTGPRVAKKSAALSEDELEVLNRILAQVQTHTGHDFSQYKRSTMLRRIQRRMQLNGNHTLDAYLSKLRHDAAEARSLFNDLLIGVTNFFRDRASWEALAEQVIPQLFEGKVQGVSVRAWSIGCATGEEAYSLAILLLEHAATLERPLEASPGLQVFASDLDDNALEKAREGVYPKAIEADVSQERLARWFVKDGHYYRVRQELRDVVLFSNHSVLRDPPFSRVDLISCRNLLIYLNRDLQENVFRIFHYALRPKAYLFLGKAESAEVVHGLFHTVDKHHRLYRARPAHGEHPHVPRLPLSVTRGELPQRLPAVGEHRPTGTWSPDARERLHQAFLEEAAPPSLLIDEQYQILHISESAGRYLLHPRGAPTNDLLALVRPELQFELRSALFQVFEQEEAVLSRPVSVQFNGTLRRVILAVRPRSGEAAAPLALVFFLEDEVASGEADAPSGQAEERLREAKDSADTEVAGRDALVARLRAENQRLRQQLQTTIEQHESSHEELKAANEELQSINEEYLSTTEELETSKEELQSLNEELQTVNSELKNKLEEISRAHSDLENLMVATDIATLFLDRELRIQRYTPSTGELFNIVPSDRGRPIDHLTNKLVYDQLKDDAARVLKSLVPVEREVQDKGGRWFLTQLRPYRTLDDRIDGVVLTFVDVSDFKETEAALRAEKEYSQKIVDTVREGLLVLQPDLTVEFANASFYQMFGFDEQETTGALIYNLGDGQWNIDELRTLLEKILPHENAFNDYRVEHELEGVGQRVMLLNARRLEHFERIMLAIEDITLREAYEADLRALNETLERRIERRTEQVQELARQLTMAEYEERARISQILHDELQQQQYSMQIQLSFLRNQAAPMPEAEGMLQEIAELEEALEMAITTARQLSVELSPPILHGEGLAEALGWLSEVMEERYKLQITTEAEGSFALPDLDRRVLLFQAVRELLFNIVKHAGVPEATVRLQQVDDAELGAAYAIDVIDYGKGFDPETVLGPNASAEGRGLQHVRERLRFIGGRLEVRSTPDDGTQMTITVPPQGGPPATAAGA